MGKKKEKKLLKNALDICEIIASFAKVYIAKKDDKSTIFLSNRSIWV